MSGTREPLRRPTCTPPVEGSTADAVSVPTTVSRSSAESGGAWLGTISYRALSIRTGQLAQPLRIRFRDGAPVLQDVHRQSVHVDVEVTADLHVGAQVVARPGGLVHMAGAQPVGAKDLLALEPVEVPAGTGPCGKRLPVLQRERRQSRQLLQEKIECSVRRVAPRPSSGPSSGRPLPWTASHCQGRYSGGPFDADADGPLAGPALAAGVCGPVRALPLRRRSPLKDGLRQEVGRDASCARCHCGPGSPPADVADSLPG
ncbi:hypothetical protein SUDANB135_00197 [Streptomyces sp. SudanB135_2055]